jgi:hypothetical protein
VPDWSSVGCGSHRAVADVAADADPYSGLAVHDTSPACEEEGQHWCPIGGTSLASPLIASVFALAGGANGVQYPAQTLYQNAAKSPESLHDVTKGSNGECRSPFNEPPACSPTEEAKTSCASEAICLAQTGYDGPTGVGTPNGIAAFELPAGGLSEEGSGEEAGSGGASGSGSGGGGPGGSTGTGTNGSPTSGAGSTSSPVAVAGTPTPAQRVQLSGLALTSRALVALNTSRPKIAGLSFTFMVNITARVRVTLSKRVGKRGHRRWQTLAHPLTITAIGGRNSWRLSGHGVLGPGTYRLMLAPVGGATRSIVFKIG